MLEAAVDVIVPVVLLDVLGLALNAWLLYIIKVRTPVFNAIDVIQVFKIVFVTFALVFTVWFEFLPCQQQTSVLSTKICIEAQEFTEDCFFHSICWMLVAVALVRKKVCECRGRASVLVTRRYGIKTLVLCLTPGCLFMAVSGTLLFQGEVPDETGAVDINSTDSKAMWRRVTAISTRSSIVFTVCHAVVLGFLPLALLCGLYLKISGIVRHTAQAASELVPIRNRDPFKNIIRSLVIHLTLSCSLWATYHAVRIIEVSTYLDHSYNVFTKLVILIAHPFGEGLLQPSFKKQTEVVHRNIQARANRRIVPSSNASFSDFRTFIDERSMIAGDWTRPTRGPGRNFSDNSSGGGGTNFKHKSTATDTASLKSHGKGRKESREELRKALKLLGGDDQLEYSRIRRLSTSLRFSTTSYPAHDMYDSYSMINHSPVLSSFRRQMVNNNVCEGYISPETVIKDFKDFDSDSSSSSRSHRRWKRLLTTARTVKRFSRTRLTSNSALESCLEDVDDPVGNRWTNVKSSIRKKNTSGSDMDKLGHTNKLDNNVSWSAKDSKNSDKNNKVDVITRPDALLGLSRQPSGNHASASRDDTMHTRRRARAVSCVNNEWLQHQQEKDKRAQRKESLEETVVIETDQALPLNRADLIRSMSYDAKKRFTVAIGATGVPEPERREKRRVSRRQSRYSRHSRSDIEAVEATRNECIKRLQDMSEYF